MLHWMSSCVAKEKLWTPLILLIPMMLHITNVHCYFTWWLWVAMRWSLPVNIYLFKDNNGNTRKRCEICSKLIIKAYEQRHWRDVVLLSLLLTLNIYHTFFYVSISYYEQAIACCASSFFQQFPPWKLRINHRNSCFHNIVSHTLWC